MSTIPAGIYQGRAIADSAQYGFTKNGNEQIVLDLNVPELGRRLSTFLVFSQDATPYSLKKLRACGWQGADVTDLTGIDSNEIDVEVTYEQYQGKEQMKVQIKDGGSFKIEAPMAEQQKRAFAAKMRQFAAAAPVVKPAARPAEPPRHPPAPNASAPRGNPFDAPAADPNDDPIPF